MRDKRERKRLRLNPTHRWSDTQTKILLAAILDELQANGVNAFEKPTAMRFYDKITRNVEEINGFATWTVCRSKMRHLKQNYLQALEWNKKTGAGLLAEGNTRAVTEYMAKCCPFWDLLDKIFGQNGQSLKQEEESGEGKDDPLLVVLREEDYANEHYENEEEDDDEYEEREENGIDNSETDQTFSENDFNAFKNQFKQKTTKPAAPARQPTTGKTCNKSTSSTTTFSANSGSIAVLVSMQEKKLQFEEMKWRQQQEHELQKIELEREKCKLMKMELKQRQELKRLEIERDERLAMAKMQLETESEERIKKYELELKIKNNLY